MRSANLIRALVFTSVVLAVGSREAFAELPVASEIAGEAPPVTIRVNPDVVCDIGGYSEVQRIFGLMWGGGIPPRVDEEQLQATIRELNINAGRAIFNGWVSQFPASRWWDDPPADRRGEKLAAWNTYAPRFETWEQSFQWWDEWVRKTEPSQFWFTQMNHPPRAMRFRDGSMGRGYEMTICANGQELLDGRCDRNRPAAAQHFLAIAKAFKENLSHDIRLRFFQMSNEPNSTKTYLSQFREPPQRDGEIDMEAGVDAYTRVFNETYATFKRECPDVQVVGTDPGWNAPFYYDGPGNGGHGNWQMWAKRFIDGIADPDAIRFYNYHAYSVAPSTHLAYLGMTRNYAWLRHDRKPRAVITETSHFVPKFSEAPREKRREQFLHTLQDIFMQLSRPDLFDTRHQFIAYGPVGDRLLLIECHDDGTFVPQVNYWALWALRHTRGKILAMDNPSPSVRSFAVSDPAGRIVVSLFNPGGSFVDVTLDSGWAKEIDQVRVYSAAYLAKITNCEIQESTLPLSRTVKLRLDPCSVTSVVFEAAQPASPTRQTYFREFFGDQIELDLNIPQTVSIAVPSDSRPKTATLRLAFEHLRENGNAAIEFNDHTLSFNWSDAPRSLVTFARWLPKEASWIGVPVDVDQVGDSNTIVINPIAGQRLLYAALELTYEELDATN